MPGAAFVAVCTLGKEWSLLNVKLYPVTVALRPRAASGFPMLADEETGARIIHYVGQLSTPFGTKIELRDGVGFVKL